MSDTPEPLVPDAPHCPDCKTNVDVEDSVKGGDWWFCYGCNKPFRYQGEGRE